MKASIIISVYRNTETLRTILDSLKKQTEQDFEIIISEDGQSDEMREFVAQYDFAHSWQHLTQEDDGWRKNRALNRAVAAARSEWLIFIDGDCVLHPKFVEWHIKKSGEKKIVAGKRVKLNPDLSKQIIDGSLSLNSLSIHLLPRLINRKGCRYVGEGFYCPLGSLRKVKHIVGSNMSVSRQALIDINGFDENYTTPAVGEDYDIEWRLKAKGYKLVSVRNCAVQYHLWHKENWNREIQNKNQLYCSQQQDKNQIICNNGINKY